MRACAIRRMGWSSWERIGMLHGRMNGNQAQVSQSPASVSGKRNGRRSPEQTISLEGLIPHAQRVVAERAARRSADVPFLIGV